MEQRLRSDILLAVVLLAACSPDMANVWGDDSDGGVPSDGAIPCSGLSCRVARCDGGKKTTLSGAVRIPAGTLTLPNVSVYVPGGPLDPIESGATCNRCDGALSGNPITQTMTDAQGRFLLENVPSGEPIPLVIQAGKWRRKVTLTDVRPCVDNPVEAELTRLPRSQGEGHLPKIALTTGEVDALECFLRKIGLDDSEFTPEYGSGRVNLFAGENATDRFDRSLHGGALFTPAPVFWGQLAALKQYDVVVLACEGVEFQTNKSSAARQAMQDYLNQGGRVFASHWHNSWIEQGPPPFPSLATWNHRSDLFDHTIATVDTSWKRGAAFADWLTDVGASKKRGELDLVSVKCTIEAVDPKRTQRYIHVPEARCVQYMSFNAPVGADEKGQCGRLVLTDIHVSDSDRSATDSPFPTGCLTKWWSPQEMALVYMFFDLSNCLQPVIG
jgi:hypothetical protein